jgi:hypothetical protein
MLVETRCALGTKLITHVDVLSWGTLTRLVRGSPIKHRVGSAPTTVYWTTRLRINENLIGSFGGG